MTAQLDLFKPAGPPPIQPIQFADARLLSGSDTYRLLCGEPRETVVEERKAILRDAGYDLDSPPEPEPAPEPKLSKVEPTDPFALSRSTYINLFEGPLRFRINDAQGGEIVVHPERCVWLRRQTIDKLDFFERECLVLSQDVLSLVRMGEVELTSTIFDSLTCAGLKPERI